MLRNILRLLVVGIFTFFFVLFLKHYVVKKIVDHNQQRQEIEAVGNTNAYNPRIEDIQKSLKVLNLYAGPINGLISEKLRSSISSFQEKRGLPVTGVINTKTLTEIIKVENNYNVKITQVNGPESLDLEEKKVTVFVDKVKKDDSLDKKVEIQDKIIQSRMESNDRVKKAQLVLQKAGFYKGNIDGKIGEITKNAIKEFQKANNLKVDGVLGPKTWETIERNQ